jgi:phosphatidylglycerophosphatase A
MMMRVHQLWTSCLGIGYIKGGGTIAAALTCGIWYLSRTINQFDLVAAVATLLVTILGTWSASKVEVVWGKDSSRVVIDEVAGMMTGLLFIPVTPQYLLTGFVLFRILDITKPLLIRRTESLPGGWGVMMDDIIAGLYTNLLLHTVMWLNVF